MLIRDARWLGVVAVVIGVGVSGVAVVGAVSPDGKPRSYSGKLLTAAGGDVSFRVKYRRGVPKVARFSLRSATGGCEGGSEGVTDFARVNARFFNRHEFRHDSYYSEDGFFTFYRVRGELKGKRFARGDVLYFADPDDPPGTTNLAECHIRGQWQARGRR